MVAVGDTMREERVPNSWKCSFTVIRKREEIQGRGFSQTLSMPGQPWTMSSHLDWERCVQIK